MEWFKSKLTGMWHIAGDVNREAKWTIEYFFNGEMTPEHCYYTK